jgi:glucose/arabinose dehydrogenase
MGVRNRIARALAASLCLATVVSAEAQNYRLERVAAGLNQPTYVTQAPNDPANILYYTERTRDANPGFGASNQMGRVWRYDLTTRTKTQVLDLSQYFVTNDTGLQTVAFHPNFNTPAAAGYGKMYVSHAEASGSPTDTARNRVEEYTIDLSGPNPTYAATFSRLLLQYDNNRENNHTIDWIGFDPTAAGNDRNHLYISTGDGSFGAPLDGGISPTGRPSQNPNDVAGKMLRVDVAGADAYPADPLKNFAIPTTNPFPTYNAAHPGSPISGLGEVYLTGLRNTYRASFDRQTGDLWMGDVGENTTEEVNFLKAGTNVTGPPVDYGWPQREGTSPSGVSGTTGATVNPFTGVTSLESVWQFPRGGAAAAIGGYLYRGPVAELQGKYFYSNFVGTGQAWMLEFDRNTNPASYNGANGTNTDVNALWQSLVFDFEDPTYSPESTTASSAGIDHVVSFGEDNSGNLYIVDFGNGATFNGQYPGAGLGEIFRVVPIVQMKVAIDRVTGEMTFSNESGAVSDIRGYQLQSASGSIDPDELTPITNRLDNGPNGNGQIDPTNIWSITSPAGDHLQFAEASTGGAASLSVGESFELSPGDGWIQSIYEDVQLAVTLADGTLLPAVVEFVGNNGAAFERSDLNFSGGLDPGDWDVFRIHHREAMAGLSRAQSYQLGDLDGDGDNDFVDFRLFQGDYVAENGAAAFAALASIPEPASGVLLLLASALAAQGRIRVRRRAVLRVPARAGEFAGLSKWSAIGAIAVSLMGNAAARADLVHQYTFNSDGALDVVGTANGTLEGDAAISLGKVNFPGTTGSYVNLPGATIGMTSFVDMTFEAWFTYGGGGAWQRVFDFGRTVSGLGQDYVFYSPGSGGGDNRAVIRNANFAENVAFGGPPVSVGPTHHVAVVIDDDANGGSNQMSLYLDGTLADDVGLSYSLSQLSNSLAYLGRSVFNSDPYLNGTIDEFRIYDHALTPSEVTASFTAGPVPLDLLRLDVNTVTGDVAVVNGSGSIQTFDYYRVSSAAGALDAADWNSLDNQNVDAIGGGSGQSWDELGAATANEISEAFLLGATSLAPGASRSLGKLYDPTVAGKREAGDLVFEFALQGTELLPGIINYNIPPPLAGDYNDDGTVNAADYTVWRDHLGATFQLANEVAGVTPGLVTSEDFTAWKTRFGDTLEGGSGALAMSVPEPATGSLLAISLVALWIGRRQSN